MLIYRRYTSIELNAGIIKEKDWDGIPFSGYYNLELLVPKKWSLLSTVNIGLEDIIWHLYKRMPEHVFRKL
jgi:hypothetical protein